jgi:hypothetical protein
MGSSLVTDAKKPILKRNEDGSIPGGDIKAIYWYTVKHTLRRFGTNAWPIFNFRNQAGEIVKADLVDIKGEYEEFKAVERRKRARKTAA